MTEGGRFYRVYENLDELVSVVETARGVLVSGSCVVPRGHVLDLLDDLREALPAEMEEARSILEQRTDLLVTAEDDSRRMVAEARAEAYRLMTEAQDASEQGLAMARGQAESTVAAARTEAQALAQQGREDYERAVHAGRSEHDRLVSDTDVHHSAAARSQQLVAEATARAERITADADAYVETRLSEFAETLAKILRSVEAGRGRLRGRGSDGPPLYDQDGRG
ncbi:MAG: DivIVA domain-containing protein [Geodermatophilaceae bacterium]|nr:DivIVA domain-containing protein [Geodermatophilaceae bacterium]